MNIMILLVDLKIVLVLHPKGNEIWSKSRLIYRFVWKCPPPPLRCILKKNPTKIVSIWMISQPQTVWLSLILVAYFILQNGASKCRKWQSLYHGSVVSSDMLDKVNQSESAGQVILGISKSTSSPIAVYFNVKLGRPISVIIWWFIVY